MPRTNERLKEVRDQDRAKYNKTVRDWRAKNPERALRRLKEIYGP